MPIAWGLTEYTQAYRARVRNPAAPDFGTAYTYGRRYAQIIQNPYSDDTIDLWHERIAQVVAKTRLSLDATILIVGCGFGFLIEAAIIAGASKVWGTDISPWIQANKASHARVDVSVFDINILDADAAIQLRGAGTTANGKFNWIITEDVVSLYDPVTELPALLNACDALRTGAGGVVHLVTPLLTRQDNTLGIRWRLLAEWALERNTHYWLSTVGFEILGGV